MIVIKTITLFDQSTGKLGPVYSGSEEDIADILLLAHVEGSYDSTKYKVNLTTREVEEITEPRKSLMHELRNQRDETLENYRWTIMPDSPLSESNKAQWLIWLKSLQSLLINVTPETTDSVVWPTKPTYEYA